MRIFLWNVQKLGANSPAGKRDDIHEIVAGAEADVYAFTELSTPSAPGNIREIAEEIATAQGLDVRYCSVDAGDGYDSYGLIKVIGPMTGGRAVLDARLGKAVIPQISVGVRGAVQRLMGPRQLVEFESQHRGETLKVYVVHPSPAGAVPKDTFMKLISYLMQSTGPQEKVMIVGDFNIDLSDPRLASHVDALCRREEKGRAISIAYPRDSTQRSADLPIDGAIVQGIRPAMARTVVGVEESPTDHAPVIFNVALR